jgi:hypothetical protein
MHSRRCNFVRCAQRPANELICQNLLAVIGEIDAQVHEIVLAPAGFVNDPFEHGLVDLIGDVSQHDLNLVSSCL